MSSVHKLPGKPNWVCFYTDRTGRRRTKSTKTTNREEAKRICTALQSLEKRAKAGTLNADSAREVLESKLAEILQDSGQVMESDTVAGFADKWLRSVEVEVKESTFAAYKSTKEHFIEWMGPRAQRPISLVTVKDIEEFRTEQARKFAPSTTNLSLRIIRLLFASAEKRGLIAKNPVDMVSAVSQAKMVKREPFTLPQLKRIFAAASQDWKTAVLFGLYYGLRISDASNVRWSNIDLEQANFNMETRKTGRVVDLPLVPAIVAHLGTLPAPDAKDAPLCPSLADRATTTLSAEFIELLVSLGIASASGSAERKKSGLGRVKKYSPLSFHSLRHSATSLLKSAGVSDAVARDIVGHDSETTSRRYTHIDTTAKREALKKMPELGKEAL